MDSFSTDRLTSHRLTKGDLAELCRMHSDLRVMATLGGLKTDAQTREFLNQQLDHWERHGFGLWMFRDKSDGLFVGRAGLRHVEVEGRDEVELGYALRAEAWGKGLATEMARALLRIGFEHLSLTDLVSFTLPTNAASRRVMEKVGFAYERDIVYAGLPHVLYRITAPGWARAHRQ